MFGPKGLLGSVLFCERKCKYTLQMSQSAQVVKRRGELIRTAGWGARAWRCAVYESIRMTGSVWMCSTNHGKAESRE